MATSGITELRYTLNEVILEALQEIMIASQGETIDGTMLKQGTNTLNRLIMEWQAQGIHLWTYTEGTLFLEKGVYEYNFGTARLANTVYRKKTTQAEIIGASTITLDNVTNLVSGSNIGILLDDNTMQWTTINGAPSGLVVTLSDVLTRAVISGATVFDYSATESFKIVSRLMNNNIRRVDDRNQEIPIQSYSRPEYNMLPYKDELGYPVAAYYETSDSDSSSGTMFVWNSPQTSELSLRFTYERMLQVFGPNDGLKTLDFPQYWQEAIIMNLAARLIKKYGVTDPSIREDVFLRAQQSLDAALSYDNAVTDFQIRLHRWQ